MSTVGGTTTIAFTLNPTQYVVLANNVSAANLRGNSSSTYTLYQLSTAIDFYDFFSSGGGSIDLVGATGTAAKTYVISEIMWGRDEDPTSTNPNGSQWIEIFSPLSAAGVAGSFKLVLTRRDLTEDADFPGEVVVDKMSTHPEFAAAWNPTVGSHGQGGHDGYTTAGVVVPPKTFVSMNRKINFTDLKNKDKNEDKLKAIADGTQSGNWAPAAAERGDYITGNVHATPGEAGGTAEDITRTKDGSETWCYRHQRGRQSYG